MIYEKRRLNGKLNAKQTLKGTLSNLVVYVEPITQEKIAVPTREIQEVVPDIGYTGLSKVTVNGYVPVVGSKKITSNGTYIAIDDNLDGYSEVEVKTEQYAPRYIKFQGYNGTDLDEETNIDTSNLTSMENMFNSCYYLTRLDVSNFDTSNVTNMGYMFGNCSKLTTLDLSNFDTSNVTNMSYMFGNCSTLATLDVSNFDTSNVTNMSGMFDDCSKLTTLDLSNFNTSKVTKMNSMFWYCRYLTTLNLSNFDTSNVTDMGGMFYFCDKLTTLDLSNFNTSKVNYTGNMFAYCMGLTTLILNNSTVFKITDSNSFTNSGITKGICTIYVPDDLIDTYKADTYWGVYSSQIKSMSEYSE